MGTRGKLEIEENNPPAETAHSAGASQPESVTWTETPAAQAPDQLRPRARLIDASPPADKKEVERLKPAPNEVKVLRPAAPVQPLARPSHHEEPATRYPGLARVLGVARKVIPVVQKVLPLLEGNVPLTVANLLAPTLEAPRRPVDLHPLETTVDALNSEQVELRKQIEAQAATVHRLGERVAALQEQADRNARERKEMAEGLRRLRRRVTWIAWVGFLLLVASLAVNGVLLGRALGLLR